MVVDVRVFSFFHSILAFVVIASLLSMPVAVVTEDMAFTPFEDALFAASFFANDDVNSEDCPLKTEPDRFSNAGELAPVERLRLPGVRLHSTWIPGPAVPAPKDLISEIFIPPRITS